MNNRVPSTPGRSHASSCRMAIVGITEQFIFDKIPKDMYRQEIYLFQECVHSRLLNKPTTVTFVDGYGLLSTHGKQAPLGRYKRESMDVNAGVWPHVSLYLDLFVT